MRLNGGVVKFFEKFDIRILHLPRDAVSIFLSITGNSYLKISQVLV